jgi:hypothetical protein
MALDRHNNYVASVDGPYTRAAAVTPDDNADLPFRTLALRAVGAGVIAVRMAGSTTAVNIPILANGEFRGRVDRVMQTNTTATGIVALD